MTWSPTPSEISGHLERAFGCNVNDAGTRFEGRHIVGDGAATRHYGLYWLNLPSSDIPPHWRDQLRYGFRKNARIAETIQFVDSMTACDVRGAELRSRFDRFCDSGSPPEKNAPFLAIQFAPSARYEVTILVTWNMTGEA